MNFYPNSIPIDYKAYVKIQLDVSCEFLISHSLYVCSAL